MKVIAIVLALLVAAHAGASADDAWARYVPEFNAQDEELYTNAVPNSRAEEFLRANAPSFRCPDKDIERTYHFRWWTYRKHIKKLPGGGWVVTEFLPSVPWAGPENTINCATGHHIREGRWLADASITWEYLKFMLEKGRMNGPRAYSCWPAVSLVDWLDVTGDTQRALALKPLLERNFAAWEKGWTMKPGRWFWWWPGFWYRIGRDDCGLFEITDNFEGSEMSLGGDGYRPLVNSAMYGEALALARLCRLAGEEGKAAEYERKASELEAKVKKSLWNAEREFFTTMRTDSAQSPVRELHGYAPWYFGMPLDGYEKAWAPILGEDGFRAPLGLTFPERSAAGFAMSYEGHECQWNGPSWPFATSIALTALAKHLQGAGPRGAPDGTFAELLSQYARQHRRRLADGTEVPWIDEDVNPFTGDWISRTIILNTPEMKEKFAKERGRDYNHSTFCDLVISGLAGFLPHSDGTFDVKPLAPREWEWFSLRNLRHCGHIVDIDYRRGRGLVVKVDGKTAPFPAQDAVALAPWVTDEEREFVKNRVSGIDTVPGAPEEDATRFYGDGEPPECVEFNYDETKAGVLGVDYTLEDPLAFADGRRLKDASEWPSRRMEILGLFEREVYGRMPPVPEALESEMLSERLTEDRFAVERRYRVWFRSDRTGPFVDWLVHVPRHAPKPCPVILHLNYMGNDSVAKEGRTNHYVLPFGEITARGYAFMTAHYTQITSDAREDSVPDPFNGVCELWGRRDPGRTDNPGALMIWAWGLCRGLDLAERIPEIDARRSVVTGSSRLGKAALLAAAYDERFAVCAPNQTGAVGVQLMKRNYGETLAGQRLALAHWYCPAVWKYMDDPRSQPFDQHLLLACVAPRALLLECYHKKWFDPKGEWLAARAASPVWEFLTGRGLGGGVHAPADWPDQYSGALVRPPFGYVRRTECHGLSPYDWKWTMDFADRVFGRGDGDAPEVTWSVMHPTAVDSRYMRRVVGKALEYGGVDSFEICGLEQKGINALSLFERYPHAAALVDRDLVERTRRELNESCKIAHDAGKKVYFWHRENLVPPGMFEDVPELLDEDGEFDLLGDAYDAYLRSKIADAFDACPGLDGIVLTLTESEYSVLHNSNQVRYPAVKVVENVIGIFVEELQRRGRRFILRSFGIGEDYAKIIAGALAASGRTGVGFEIETKATEADFVPWLPINQYLKRTPPLSLGAECDAFGEFLGAGALPAAHVARIAEYVDAARREGASRYVVRIDRGGKSIFDSAHEANLCAYMRFARDMSATEDDVLSEYAQSRFGPAADDMAPMLKGELEMVRGICYIASNLVFHAPPKAGNFHIAKAGGIFALFREGEDLSALKPIWSIFDTMRTPTHEAILEEKDAAVRAADESLAAIERLAPRLPPDEFARQRAAFANAVAFARAMREFTRCTVAYFEDMSGREDEPRRLDEAVALARGEIERLKGVAGEFVPLDGLAAYCAELAEEYRVERAMRREIESRAGVVDFVVPGGIYDDGRVERQMHAAYPERKGGCLLRHVGNNRYPNGRITVRLRAPETAEIEVALDPGCSQEASVTREWSDGVWTVSVSKGASGHPAVLSVCAVVRHP